MPAFVVFITSKDRSDPPQPGSYITVDGPGEPCDVRPEQKCSSCKTVLSARQAKAAIVVQAGLTPAQYELVQLEPDDLNDAYATMRTLLTNLRRRFPNATFVSDYTGGTKTMSAALVLAALDRGDSELAVMLGQRSTLQRVEDGTEMATAVDVRNWRIQRSLHAAEELFDRYDYAAARGVLEGVLRDISVVPALRTQLQRTVQLARGFDAWDRFAHVDALRLLQPFASALGAHFQALLLLNGKGKTSGYEVAFDLLRNAERRAARAQYDDAVARLYRLVELLAQQRLFMQYAQTTSDLNVASLPIELQAQYEAQRDPKSGKIRLGLQEGYNLLITLRDPLGEAFAHVRGPLSNALTTRNSSILAHGLTPIAKAAYDDLFAQVETLLQIAAQSGLRFGRRPAQFPAFTEIAA
jgi:CRISPR-associated protein (TIGR02710 family)